MSELFLFSPNSAGEGKIAKKGRKEREEEEGRKQWRKERREEEEKMDRREGRREEEVGTERER